MKIDLHTHIREINKGKTTFSKRTIIEDKMIEIFKENGIRLASVTEHNTFDKESYDKLAQNAEGIIFFPGMEIDFLIPGNNSYKQATLHTENIGLLNNLGIWYKKIHLTPFRWVN